MSKGTRILISIAIVLWVQSVFIISIIKVDGESMDNTLVNHEKYYTRDVEATDIERFDIVTIYSEELGERIVKRVVGLPGETIKYVDDTLYVNSVAIEQNFDYISDTSEFSIQLGEEEYFVLGDNRPNSYDSRMLGPIQRDEIETILFKS